MLKWREKQLLVYRKATTKNRNISVRNGGNGKGRKMLVKCA